MCIGGLSDLSGLRDLSGPSDLSGLADLTLLCSSFWNQHLEGYSLFLLVTSDFSTLRHEALRHQVRDSPLRRCFRDSRLLTKFLITHCAEMASEPMRQAHEPKVDQL